MSLLEKLRAHRYLRDGEPHKHTCGDCGRSWVHEVYGQDKEVYEKAHECCGKQWTDKEDPNMTPEENKAEEERVVKVLTKVPVLNLEQAVLQGVKGATAARKLAEELGDKWGPEKQMEAFEELFYAALGTTMYLGVHMLGVKYKDVKGALDHVYENFMADMHETALEDEKDPLGVAHEEAMVEDVGRLLSQMVDKALTFVEDKMIKDLELPADS